MPSVMRRAAFFAATGAGHVSSHFPLHSPSHFPLHSPLHFPSQAAALHPSALHSLVFWQTLALQVVAVQVLVWQE
jgi:hypothetical protein